MTATTYVTNNAAVVAGTATIAAGESITEDIVLDSKDYLQLIIPAIGSGSLFKGNQTFLTYQVQAFTGGEWAEATTEDGNSVNTQVSDTSPAPVPDTVAHAYAIRVRSGSPGAPIVQDAEVTIQFVASSPGSSVIIMPPDELTVDQGTPNAGGTLSWPVAVGDGRDVAQGALADAAVINPAASASVISLLKGMLATFLSGFTANQGAQGSPTAPWFVRLYNGSGVALATVTSTAQLVVTSKSSAGGEASMITWGADGVSSATVGPASQALGYAVNGATTVDRLRTNQKVTLAASAARTSTLTVATQTHFNWGTGGLHAIISVTSYSSGGLTPVINGIGNLGTSYALLTGAKISSAGTTVLKIGPGFATAVNQAAADMLPYSWNMVVTPDDATSITYSIEGNINA